MATTRTPEEQAVITALLATSTAIKTKSRPLLSSIYLSTAGITRTRIAPTVLHMSGAELMDYIEAAWEAGAIEGIPDVEDAIVKVTDNMAFMHTWWRSYKAGELTHEGWMTYLWVNLEGEWKVCAIVDNLKAV